MFTDKLVAKIPSTCSGIVKEVKFEVDDVCLVGHSLLTIVFEDDGAQSSSSSSEEEESAPAKRSPVASGSQDAPMSGPGKLEEKS